MLLRFILEKIMDQSSTLLRIERLFYNPICNPISNFRSLYGIEIEDDSVLKFNKYISRLVNDTRIYKVVQLWLINACTAFLTFTRFVFLWRVVRGLWFAISSAIKYSPFLCCCLNIWKGLNPLIRRRHCWILTQKPTETQLKNI